MKSTYTPLLFLHHYPFSSLRRTWWDGVKQDVLKESRENLANPGSPERMAVKLACVCGYVLLQNIKKHIRQNN